MPAGTTLSARAVTPSQVSLDKARFIPGTVLARRYRIVSLLGRGGMGEVFRADDLKLGQSVALKFLPAEVEQDRARLERLLNEVKIARQVAHPNVCRVYDVGEVDGHHFLSMEFIDGEDLASLLRQIGRLPEEKATQIARQLCAGLAAAHEQGILHRDLKPANVMIDGRGRARITDFGLAALAEVATSEHVVVGTPAYMAPEQLAGEAVTARSDVYSLGLVLYELFTGKRAFDATTPEELLRLHRESTPPSPSGHIEGLDPSVERIILGCLAPDPVRRPSSALAVASALPGGDPLAAALAAGETPSPDVVAAAGGEGSMRPLRAVACLLFVILGTLASASMSGRTGFLAHVPADKPPEVLAERAGAIVARIVGAENSRDSAYGFSVDPRLMGYLAHSDESPTRWTRLRSGRLPALFFWYRQSPQYLVAEMMSPVVDELDPRPVVPGMVGLRLDPLGRLLELQVTPPEHDEARGGGPAEEPDWNVLFEEADLDPGEFTPATPSWIPPQFCDTRAAWDGPLPGEPETRIRIEAGGYRGKPSYFRVIGPWVRIPEAQEQPGDLWDRASNVIGGVVFVGLVAGGLFLARRNLRLGRVDRRGARRLAGFAFAVNLLSWLLMIDHVPVLWEEIGLCARALALVILETGFIWIAYMGLEPFIRRRWPDTIVSWNRLLAGRPSDPLVGRSVLIGVTFTVFMQLFQGGQGLVREWLGQPTDSLHFPFAGVLLGGRFGLAGALNSFTGGVLSPLATLLLLLLLRLLLQKLWLAIGALVLLPSVLVLASDRPWEALSALVFLSLTVLVLVRFGLLAAIASWFSANVYGAYLATLDFSVWYAARLWIPVAVILAMSVYAFHVARAGRPLFEKAFAD